MALKNIFTGAVRGSENLIASGYTELRSIQVFNNGTGSMALEFRIGPSYAESYPVQRNSIPTQSGRTLLEEGARLVVAQGQNLYLDSDVSDEDLNVCAGGIGN